MKISKRERTEAQPRYTFVCPPATTSRPVPAQRPPRRSVLALRLRLVASA